jgi:hypothetical protein
MRARYSALLMVLAVSVLAVCQADGTRDPETALLGVKQQAIDAICTVEVIKDSQSLGVKDVEGDYLPNVVNCESGDLDTEALKVQAVLSRTYVYYKLAGGGTAITSGTAVQVYDCARKIYLAQKHYDAVNATSGQILMYKGNPIWPCFVAGLSPTVPPCTPGGGEDNCCTSNEGKSGDTIEQSPCGYVDPTNYKNRGCSCQNGADCYAKEGKTYVEILKAYFGDDIEFVTVTGNCIAPQDGGTNPQDATNPPDDAPHPPGDSQGQDQGSAADTSGPAPDGSAGEPQDGSSARAWPAESGSDGGCSMTPSGRGASGRAWMLLALAAFAPTRRR